ncbi:MAG: hypothetical protein C5B50_06270 [Verrucomicrobia bacterium]|nr:MAG: hypothetical protein C5B50_06270 [Verrucomicrobiota bacterium]
MKLDQEKTKRITTTKTNNTHLAMKKFLALTALLGASSLTFGQGYVVFSVTSTTFAIKTNNNTTAAGRVAAYNGAPLSTNGPGVSFYYELLAAPTTQTTIDASLNGWTSVFEGTNTLTVGRMFGANSPDGQAVTVNVLGVNDSSTVNFAVVGWSANLGSDFNSVYAGRPLTLASLSPLGQHGFASWAQTSAPPPSGWTQANLDTLGVGPGGWYGISSPMLNVPLAPNGGPYNNVWNPAWVSSGFTMSYYTVPEPATFALAGLGVAALLIFRRRQAIKPKHLTTRKQTTCLPMKKLLTVTALLAAASLSFGQGYVTFSVNQTTFNIKTNNNTTAPGNAAAYNGAPQSTSPGPGVSWYYELLAAPTTQTTIDASLGGWTPVFTGTNTATAGRMFGANSPDGNAVTVNVLGATPTSTLNFAVVGWSANLGSDYNAVNAGKPLNLVSLSPPGQHALEEDDWNQTSAPAPNGWTQANLDTLNGGPGGWYGISSPMINVPLSPNGGPYQNVWSIFYVSSGLVMSYYGVPEPATFTLAGLGAVALLIFRRKKVT